MKTKLILWDLSEVFIKGLLGAEEIIAKELQIPLEEAITGIGVNNTKPELTGKLFTGQIHEDDYIQSVLFDTSWPITADDLKRLIRQNMTLIDGTQEILSRLSTKYDVAALSNHAREWFDHCDSKYNLSSQFNNQVFISSDLGVTKPDPESFHFVLNRLNYKPEEVIFIDDSSSNVQAARELGMNTIQFTNASELEKIISNMQLDNDILAK